MLRFENLVKSFNGRRVIDRANADLAPGVFALQGANGIGKSTLLGLLSGALALDAGNVWIDGVDLIGDPMAARLRLSYVPDESPVYPFMTGREFLEFVALSRHVPPDDETDFVVRGFRLEPHLATRFSAMSLGTQKKFLIAAAWIGDPRVLLLDEPANGLDTSAREFLADLIRRRAACSTVLLSVHELDFVQAVGATVLPMEAIVAA